MSDEKEDLTHLLKSPGWLRFVDAQKNQWTEHISHAMASAASDRDDSMALQKIRQVIAAQRAILGALEWPTERLRQLTVKDMQQVATSMSRGGFQ